MNSFVVADPKRCIGCRTCEIACVLAHSNGEGMQAMTPSRFTPRLELIQTAKLSAPVQCHQCEDAPCARACPNKAIVFADNSVQVQQERCIGCKNCMMACPFGIMKVVMVERVEQIETISGTKTIRVKKSEAQKCDLCHTNSQGPACVRVCPTKSLHLVDQNKVASTIKARQELAIQNIAAMSN